MPFSSRLTRLGLHSRQLERAGHAVDDRVRHLAPDGRLLGDGLGGGLLALGALALGGLAFGRPLDRLSAPRTRTKPTSCSNSFPPRLLFSWIRRPAARAHDRHGSGMCSRRARWASPATSCGTAVSERLFTGCDPATRCRRLARNLPCPCAVVVRSRRPDGGTGTIRPLATCRDPRGIQWRCQPWLSVLLNAGSLRLGWFRVRPAACRRARAPSVATSVRDPRAHTARSAATRLSALSSILLAGLTTPTRGWVPATGAFLVTSGSLLRCGSRRGTASLLASRPGTATPRSRTSSRIAPSRAR